MNMISVHGTFLNGYVKLEGDYITINPVKVIVTFLEPVHSISNNGLSLADFSFSESKNNLSDFSGSFSDTLIEERQKES